MSDLGLRAVKRAAAGYSRAEAPGGKRLTESRGKRPRYSEQYAIRKQW